MYSVTVTILLAFLAQACAMELEASLKGDTQNSMEKLADVLINKSASVGQDVIDKLVDTLFDRALKAWILHETATENTALGKPRHLALALHSSLKPFLLPPRSPMHPSSRISSLPRSHILPPRSSILHPPSQASSLPRSHILSGARRPALDTIVRAEEIALSEENVEKTLQDCREELSTMFDSPENNKVGITGKVYFVELDGPVVIIGLKGRFWHARERVLERVAKYLTNRIPEIVDVELEDEAMLDNYDFGDDDKKSASDPPAP